MTTLSPTNGKLFIQYGLYPADSSNVAIPIDIINQQQEVWQNVLYLGRQTEVDLAAGPYQVRAYLPSDEVLIAQAQVEAGQQSMVSLKPNHPSPREELTWAYFLKEIGALATQLEPLPEGFKPFFTLWQRAPGPSDFRWEIASNGPAPLLEIDETIQQSDPNALAVVWLNPRTSSATSLGELPRVMDQYWLQVKGPASVSQFVALPIPSPERTRVGVLVVRDVDERLDRTPLTVPDLGSVSVLVNMGNAPAEMLLGYLAAGAFRAARRVGENIVDMAKEIIQKKQDNPSKVAIAGYYLLLAGQQERLGDWTQSLSELFPWMPDGAVIHAWHLMRKDRPNLDQAREHLLQAEQRGLPMFTQGLRLLFDGMEFFAHKSPSDETVVLARDRLQLYVRATNWRALTTTFYGDTPSQPYLPFGFRG